MSKAKERAKERYWLEPCNIDTQNKYHAYIEGYRQAEKDLDTEQVAEIAKEETIKEVCEWLEENAEGYIYIEYGEDGRPTNNAKLAIKYIEDLKKYLKENG